MTTHTDAEYSLSLKVQVAAEYLRYLESPEYADDVNGIAWATTRLESIIAEANACKIRGPVVHGVSAEAMKRLRGIGLDEGIEAEKETLRND